MESVSSLQRRRSLHFFCGRGDVVGLVRTKSPARTAMTQGLPALIGFQHGCAKLLEYDKAFEGAIDGGRVGIPPDDIQSLG